MAGASLALLLAACGDNVGIGACFEPDAVAYPYHLPGDTGITFRWPASYRPVRVYAEPKGELVTNVTAALELWQGAFRCGEMSFVVATDSTAADIIVRNPEWLPRQSFRIMIAADSVGACDGVTTGEWDSTNTLVGPIRSYVAPVPAADSAALAGCYRIVTAHEIGHAIGLFSHSSDTLDIMHSRPRRRELSVNDRYTVQLLYHDNPTLRPAPR
jgi:predicted Zn-dependent protease